MNTLPSPTLLTLSLLVWIQVVCAGCHDYGNYRICDGLDGGAIAGIVIGIVAFFGILGFLLYMRRQRQKRVRRDAVYVNATQAPTPMVGPSTKVSTLDAHPVAQPAPIYTHQNNFNPYPSPVPVVLV
ncbi:hypothetical protein NLI96_g2419 [Meripilus lineatus]|uniref:Uncharacterized protein n=1 Tax=Meripilus lineatus TaxID=2056292 RepID=A0AAD5VE44_9APHY|nr:hypothetical protein NLI96_g2419 [Physisporinus lineatus]